MKKIILACLMSLICVSSFARSARPALPSLAPMLQKVMPSVVNISVEGDMKSQSDSKTRRQPGDSRRKFRGLGSGVIMNPEKGYIITNAHVLKDAKVITVTLNDGRRVKAKLIGADPNSDIAVVSIKAKNLQAIPIADSSKLRVGDFTVAIGNPFGLNYYGTNQTATMGIISALQRSDIKMQGLDLFIQTDAAINPGNSGGALVNMKGELIGINTAIISPFGGNVGIGLAIPVNTARDVLTQIVKYGSIHRGLMGIFVQHLTPELAEAFNMPNIQGALVTKINAGSPAEKAGLETGDVIQSINDQVITDAAQVKSIVGIIRVGSKVSLKVYREGKSITLEAVVADVKKNQEKLAAKNPFLFGVALSDFEQESPLHGYVKGVQVVGAMENSAAYRAGVRPGDVIIEANKTPVKTLKELGKVAGKHKDQLILHVLRSAGALFIVIK